MDLRKGMLAQGSKGVASSVMALALGRSVACEGRDLEDISGRGDYLDQVRALCLPALWSLDE